MCRVIELSRAREGAIELTWTKIVMDHSSYHIVLIT